MHETIHDETVGHLFIVDGDLNKIHADAVLVPTSAAYHVRPIWDALLRKGWESRVDRSNGNWKVNPDPATLDSECDIWFANVGSIASSPGPYVAVAEHFVRRAAEAFRTGAQPWSRERPPLLALNALGTGDGGMFHQRGELLEQLVGRLKQLAEELGVDIVLVAWGTKQYAAARRAQRYTRSQSTLSRVPDPILHRDDIRQAVRALSREALLQRLVLFVGAGASKGAGLPDWDELIRQLAVDIETHIDLSRLEALDSRDRAQVLMSYLGEESFRSRVVAALHSNKYGLSHALLASLDAHEVVTTNYDTLLEDAYGTARRPAVLPQSSVGPDGRWMLKLHGCVSDPASIVLARQDYLGLPERSAALFGILQAMLMTKHMLFVGYSLTDDTFHRVMHDVRRARGEGAEPIGTALLLFEDPLMEHLWGDVLRFVAMEPRPQHVTAADLERAARKLEIVLDEVAVQSADISSFLLDPTYEGVLEDTELEIRAAVSKALELAARDKHVGASILGMLRSLTNDDPKDAEGSRFKGVDFID